MRSLSVRAFYPHISYTASKGRRDGREESERGREWYRLLAFSRTQETELNEHQMIRPRDPKVIAIIDIPSGRLIISTLAG